MELRQYWRIIVRRWWLPVALFVLVALISLITQRPWQARAVSYTASLRFNVGLRPEPRTGDYYTYDRYYTWLGSEYLIDDLSEIVKGSSFAGAVSRRLAGRGLAIPAGAIQGATSSGKLHRILTVSLSWPNADDLGPLTQALSETMQSDLPLFYQGLLSPDAGSSPVEVVLIDGPQIAAVGPGLREQLDLPLRLGLALLAGVGLCFLLDYLDNSVRSREELEAMGLDVLAEIPRRRS